MKRDNWSPIGEARLNRALRNAQLDQHNAHLLASMARETGEMLPDRDAPKLLSRLGDELQLRGIPAIGRGVQGAMHRSQPEREATR